MRVDSKTLPVERLGRFAMRNKFDENRIAGRTTSGEHLTMQVK
jgi:hypothetical protein